MFLEIATTGTIKKIHIHTSIVVSDEIKKKFRATFVITFHRENNLPIVFLIVYRISKRIQIKYPKTVTFKF